jgi:hypothetical protein
MVLSKKGAFRLALVRLDETPYSEVVDQASGDSYVGACYVRVLRHSDKGVVVAEPGQTFGIQLTYLPAPKGKEQKWPKLERPDDCWEAVISIDGERLKPAFILRCALFFRPSTDCFVFRFTAIKSLCGAFGENRLLFVLSCLRKRQSMVCARTKSRVVAQCRAEKKSVSSANVAKLGKGVSLFRQERGFLFCPRTVKVRLFKTVRLRAIEAPLAPVPLLSDAVKPNISSAAKFWK